MEGRWSCSRTCRLTGETGCSPWVPRVMVGVEGGDSRRRDESRARSRGLLRRAPVSQNRIAR